MQLRQGSGGDSESQLYRSLMRSDCGENQISFSSKIRSQEWKDQMKALLEPEKEDEFGIIVRTNAAEAEPEAVIGGACGS